MRASSQLLPEAGKSSNVVIVPGSDPTGTRGRFTKSKKLCYLFQCKQCSLCLYELLILTSEIPYDFGKH